MLCADSWQDERNLYRRVERGMAAASAKLDEARKTYRSGDPYKSQEQVEMCVDIALEAYDMIVESGEDMRKRSSRFKKSEIALRGIYRKLEEHENAVDIVDRGPVERARKTISKMQDNILNGMFQGGPLPPVEKVQ